MKEEETQEVGVMQLSSAVCLDYMDAYIVSIENCGSERFYNNNEALGAVRSASANVEKILSDIEHYEEQGLVEQSADLTRVLRENLERLGAMCIKASLSFTETHAIVKKMDERQKLYNTANALGAE